MRGLAAAVRSGRFAARDVVVGGVHLHHYVPGIALLTLAGGLALRDSDRVGVHCLAGASYGTGAALVADELPMLIDFRDVYWTPEGRTGADIVAALSPERCSALVSVSGYLIGARRSACVRCRPGPRAVSGTIFLASAGSLRPSRFRRRPGSADSRAEFRLATAVSVTYPKVVVMSSPSAALPTPEGPGSVSGAPNLASGFTDTFASRYVDAAGLRMHAVIGGEGPPLLLVHGWPQNWYAWRMLMPALARDFTVVAVDQRGIGLSDKPQDGYDTGTLAGDLVALMDALGHERFALYGTDTGMPIAYALAADHPRPGVPPGRLRGPLPGISPSPPLFLPPLLNARLWHLAFNQLPRGQRAARPGREDSSSAPSSMPPPERTSCPRTPSGTTSTPSPPTPMPYAAVSSSTAPSPPPSRRTSSARPGRSPCPSWRSAERRAQVRESPPR